MCNSTQDRLGWVHRDLCHNRYRVAEKFAIARGAELYRAWDRKTQTSVVVKVMTTPSLEEPHFAGRFLREMESLIGLSHPNVVQVFDVGQEGGLPFVVVQDVPGENLIERRPALSELASWLRPTSEALDWLLTRGRVHSDLRLGNILFDGEGRVFVSEAGIVRNACGAAEQQRGLAALLQNYAEAVNESLPEAACEIVEGVFARASRLRFPTCAALADCIEHALETELLCAAVN